ALNLCYVADKKFDLYFTLNLNSWDVAAAKLVVEEAGGKTTNTHNKKWAIEDRNIVGSNRILHNKFIRLLKLI
ncbi:MAG: inositol monophosphatase family protein, partial [Candidatus Woesearchaeota archaeon]|nr:inositol monophosphatase family protein [Candidatus Woesearchaeota archaeon]